MDQDSIPSSATPVPQTSPEEDATLLAIEALEAQSVDLDAPKPALQPQATVPAPTPQLVPAPPKPAEEIKPVGVVNAPAPVAVPQPVTVAQPPKAEPIPAPKKPSTPAEEIAEALSSDTPGPKRFQFFTNQKPPRLPFVVGGIIAIVVGLGVAAYFTLF